MILNVPEDVIGHIRVSLSNSHTSIPLTVEDWKFLKGRTQEYIAEYMRWDMGEVMGLKFTIKDCYDMAGKVVKAFSSPDSATDILVVLKSKN